MSRFDATHIIFSYRSTVIWPYLVSFPSYIARYWSKFIYSICIRRQRRGWYRPNFAKVFTTWATRTIGLPHGEESVMMLC